MAASRVGKPKTPLVAVGYVRVSTDEQGVSGLGLQAQRQAIEEACRGRRLELAGFAEDVSSGKSRERRPGLDAAITQARSSGGLLVVAKLDRLSRSLLDFVTLMEEARAEGWSIVALDVGLDTSTPQGRMMVAVLATFAEYEREMISQRTRDALAVLRARGVRLGRPPLLDPAVRTRVRRARARGATLQAIADRLNADGVTAPAGGRWDRAAVHRACV
ncbi:MAG TPA: recombinase family protein [Gaiellaceae bacterium]|nr:recombinase family protein [Gaiellaceae bacterium]